MKKALLAAASAVAVLATATGCRSAADVASANLSKDADQFKIERQIVFFNGITDKYLLVIQGLCSLGNDDPARELSVTCKVGPNEYKKHFLGLSNNVSYFVEQIAPAQEDVYHYKVLFRPETIVPDITR